LRIGPIGYGYFGPSILTRSGSESTVPRWKNKQQNPDQESQFRAKRLGIIVGCTPVRDVRIRVTSDESLQAASHLTA
jgi:hypothetical protein